MLLATAAVLAASPAAAETPQRGGTISTVLSADIRSTNPGVDRDGATDIVHQHIVEGLVGFREDLEVGPMLADRWDVSPDGKTYTFHLRQGVQFQNGATMTSAEVKWSWDRLMDPATKWRCRDVYTGDNGLKVESVTAPDPDTVVYVLDRPSAGFLYNLARMDCGGTPVLHPSSVKPDGSWDKPVGTGPFILSDWRPGQYIELTRFDGYTPRDDAMSGYVGRKEVFVDKVRFNVMPDSAAKLTALQAGALDTASLESQDRIQIQDNAAFEVQSSITPGWEALILHSEDPILQDRRVRQAIVMALDRAAIAEAVTFGGSKFSATPVPEFSPYHSQAQTDALPYDPERAKALLAEAGYTRQRIVMTANKRYAEMYDCAYSPRLDPLGQWERIIGPQPRKIWKDPRAIDLLAQANATTDRAQMQAVLDRIGRPFTEEAPAASLYLHASDYAVAKRIQGFKVWPADAPRYWNVSVAK
ncbi:MAG: ABC transporter substrate-binding protein [Inquilinus limosus]|uniref:ABC transporter substrate-binding protein n=1 Tax=Inquilinus limosus TaxID=171674 RepID=A0A952FSE8_9PROT|nr:ABC transporter substrate-binding protein [Inquilinus limosus]